MYRTRLKPASRVTAKHVLQQFFSFHTDLQ